MGLFKIKDEFDEYLENEWHDSIDKWNLGTQNIPKMYRDIPKNNANEYSIFVDPAIGSDISIITTPLVRNRQVVVTDRQPYEMQFELSDFSLTNDEQVRISREIAFAHLSESFSHYAQRIEGVVDSHFVESYDVSHLLKEKEFKIMLTDDKIEITETQKIDISDVNVDIEINELISICNIQGEKNV